MTRLPNQFAVALIVLTSLPCLAQHGQLSVPGSRVVSLIRDMPRSVTAWRGNEGCISHRYVQFRGGVVGHYEGTPTAVACTILPNNRVACFSKFTNHGPRVGVYDPATNEMFTWEIIEWKGQQTNNIYAFRISLNEPKGSSEVRFMQDADWPQGIARDDVTRPDLLNVRCLAVYDTTIKLVEGVAWEAPDPDGVKQFLERMAKLPDWRTLATNPTVPTKAETAGNLPGKAASK